MVGLMVSSPKNAASNSGVMTSTVARLAIEKTEVLPRDVDGRVPSSMEITFQPRE